MTFYNPLVLPKIKRAMAQPIAPGYSVLATGGEKTGLIYSTPFRTFLAPLTINTQDYEAKTQQTFIRASTAVHDRSGTLRVVNNNASRHERLGVLMEPESTNKCTNYSANPDEGLSGFVVGGDPAAVFERVLDAENLNNAGLGRLCTSGYVYRLDNTAGASNATVSSTGQTGNTDLHSSSAYWRGSGFASIGLSTGAPPAVSLPVNYERTIDNGRTPLSGSNVWRLYVNPGAVCYFVLNQLEEQPVSTSVIITEGSTAIRREDNLSWSLTDSQGQNILNQAEGTAAILWTPRFSDSDIPVGVTRNSPIIRLTDAVVGGDFLYFQKEANEIQNFINYDSINFSFIGIPGGLVKDQQYLIVCQWRGSIKQIGFKTLGSWFWDIERSYDGSFPVNGNMKLIDYGGFTFAAPTYGQNLYLWNGFATVPGLEGYFSDVAN